MMSTYDYLRRHRPDLLRSCVEVGSVVSCASPTQSKETTAAQVEAKMAEVLVKLLQERETGEGL